MFIKIRLKHARVSEGKEGCDTFQIFWLNKISLTKVFLSGFRLIVSI